MKTKSERKKKDNNFQSFYSYSCLFFWKYVPYYLVYLCLQKVDDWSVQFHKAWKLDPSRRYLFVNLTKECRCYISKYFAFYIANPFTYSSCPPMLYLAWWLFIWLNYIDIPLVYREPKEAVKIIEQTYEMSESEIHQICSSSNQKTKFSNDVVTYISGFIQHKIVKKEPCLSCSEYLANTTIRCTSSLINFVNRGKLTHPT